MHFQPERKSQAGGLVRPRDLAITDFRFATRADGVLSFRSGRKYLTFARTSALDETVPKAARRFAEWALYALCGGGAVMAFWFAFVAPGTTARWSSATAAALSITAVSPRAPIQGNALNTLPGLP